jgi:hypothetical protein
MIILNQSCGTIAGNVKTPILILPDLCQKYAVIISGPVGSNGGLSATSDTIHDFNVTWQPYGDDKIMRQRDRDFNYRCFEGDRIINMTLIFILCEYGSGCVGRSEIFCS